jgi:hypothetical protein
MDTARHHLQYLVFSDNVPASSQQPMSPKFPFSTSQWMEDPHGSGAGSWDSVPQPRLRGDAIFAIIFRRSLDAMTWTYMQSELSLA